MAVTEQHSISIPGNRQRKETLYHLPDRPKGDPGITSKQRRHRRMLAPEIDESVVGRLGHNQAAELFHRLAVKRRHDAEARARRAKANRLFAPKSRIIPRTLILGTILAIVIIALLLIR